MIGVLISKIRRSQSRLKLNYKPRDRFVGSK